MKQIILLLGLILSVVYSEAQDNNRNSIMGFDKVYYQENNIETGDYNVLVKNIIDYKNVIKFSMKISNNTGDFIVCKSSESKVIIDNTKLEVIGKTKTIKPSDDKSITIKCERSNLKRQASFNILLDGLYKIKQKPKSVKVADFEIPMTKKDFKFGKVHCNVSIPVRKTQKMIIKLELRNDGNEYIIIHPSRIGVEMPDGKTYTSKNTEEEVLLAPHKTEKITLKWDRMPKGGLNDMQKVDMGVNFKDVFYYAEITKLKAPKIKIEWDKQLTIKKQ